MNKRFQTGLAFGNENGVCELCFFYTYLNTPNPEVRHRSEIHWGTTRLDFDNYPVLKMVGEYWTTRKSVGRLELTRRYSDFCPYAQTEPLQGSPELPHILTTQI